MLSKGELRKQIAALRRKALVDSAVVASCDKIWDAIGAMPQFVMARTVLLYASLPDEIPTAPAMEKWSAAKTLVLPVVQGDTLVLRKYDPCRLKAGYKGIAEPDGSCAAVRPEDIDFAIVPGVAFDRRCMRMGRGKGFYDRLLPQLRCPCVGVALPCQMVDSIPADPWDVPLTSIAVAYPDETKLVLK